MSVKDQKAVEWLSGQLPGLVAAGVISRESADALLAHYGKAGGAGRSRNLAVVVFGILGGTLIGAGIILLIAHNWADMERPVRTLVSFLPLVIACLVSGWAVMKKPDSAALGEGGGIFHVLAIGSSISLVSQTYHISGDFAAFVLVWALLALPLVYLLRSTSVAMLYTAGITVWAGCAMDEHENVLWYWLLLAGVLPFYLGLLKADRFSNRSNWLSAAIGVSMPFVLGFQSGDVLERIWFLLFSGYCGVLYLVERQWFRHEWSWKFRHPFRLIGAGGIAVLAIVLSFGDLWRSSNWLFSDVSTAAYVGAYGFGYGFMVAAVALLVFCWRKKGDFNLFAGLFPVVIWIAYMLFLRDEKTAITLLMNGYAAALALGTIVRGFRRDRLETLNAGMLIAAALILARFLDSDMSFVIRGVAFIVTGIGFLATNWILLRKRKESSV